MDTSKLSPAFLPIYQQHEAAFIEVFEKNAWMEIIQSYKDQLEKRGYLSRKQVDSVLRMHIKVKKRSEIAERVKELDKPVRGEKFEMIGVVSKGHEMQVTAYTGYGRVMQLDVEINDAFGRAFNIITSNDKHRSVLREAMESKRKIAFSGVVKWASDDGTRCKIGGRLNLQVL